MGHREATVTSGLPKGETAQGDMHIGAWGGTGRLDKLVWAQLLWYSSSLISSFGAPAVGS